jgi:chromate transporter
MNGIVTTPPTALRLFLVFCRIGLTSFGGGLSGWLLRELVQERQWLGEEEFLNGLALSQALPGINVTNLAIWIGYRLHGPVGAITCFLGIVVPPAFVIVGIGALFATLSAFPLTYPLLNGAGAAAIGLSLSMGITAARRVPRRAIPLAMMAATFVAIAIFEVPLAWVALVAGCVSVALEYRRLARAVPDDR